MGTSNMGRRTANGELKKRERLVVYFDLRRSADLSRMILVAERSVTAQA
jgi:hypothetical protein